MYSLILIHVLFKLSIVGIIYLSNSYIQDKSIIWYCRLIRNYIIIYTDIWQDANVMACRSSINLDNDVLRTQSLLIDSLLTLNTSPVPKYNCGYDLILLRYFLHHIYAVVGLRWVWININQDCVFFINHVFPSQVSKIRTLSTYSSS